MYKCWKIKVARLLHCSNVISYNLWEYQYSFSGWEGFDFLADILTSIGCDGTGGTGPRGAETTERGGWWYGTAESRDGSRPTTTPGGNALRLSPRGPGGLPRRPVWKGRPLNTNNTWKHQFARNWLTMIHPSVSACCQFLCTGQTQMSLFPSLIFDLT